MTSYIFLRGYIVEYIISRVETEVQKSYVNLAVLDIPTEDDDGSEQDMINDGYDNSYEFSFGTVYTRDFDLSDCDEIRTALNKADR